MIIRQSELLNPEHTYVEATWSMQYMPRLKQQRGSVLQEFYKGMFEKERKKYSLIEKMEQKQAKKTKD